MKLIEINFDWEYDGLMKIYEEKGWKWADWKSPKDFNSISLIPDRPFFIKYSDWFKVISDDEIDLYEIFNFNRVLYTNKNIVDVVYDDAIHIKSEEEYIDAMKIFYAKWWRWSNWDSPIIWPKRFDWLCIYYNKSLSYFKLWTLNARIRDVDWLKKQNNIILKNFK